MRCSGRGHVKGHKHVDVAIPAGISDGQRIRISEGDANTENTVFVTVRVRPSSTFSRDGDDVYSEAHVSYDCGLSLSDLSFLQASLSSTLGYPNASLEAP
eukprot:m.175410 g.175410  ORF g.175410 m.175410 type:complete len:100 (-) comp53317_c0_seq1:371-670(-)